MERATVTSINDEVTVVKTTAAGPCEGCDKALCIGTRDIELKVATVPGVKVGDVVGIEVPEAKLKAILFVLFLPVCAVVVGAAMGQWATETWLPEWSESGVPAIALSALFFFVTFGAVWMHERRTRDKRPQPRIVRHCVELSNEEIE